MSTSPPERLPLSYVYQQTELDKALRLKRCPACRLQGICERHRDEINARSLYAIRQSHAEYDRWVAKNTEKDDDKNILITEPPPLLPVERIGDMCQRCGAIDNKVLPGLGYYHRECFVAKTEDDKVKPMSKANKCEEIVTLAKQTYDSILRATGDHDKACKMMAHVFISTFCE